MDSKTIRRQFISYFEESRGHTYVPGSPVIPQQDPTLLFTNAGMNQFKPYFLGEIDPPFRRVVNTQKCIRVSGKHNDLEEVGRDHYHHTFFEMLGSWSFGDYYKKEAIMWAWELFTQIWGMDPRRLYATVYRDDDEALEIWKTIPGLEASHILKFGEKDNFWSMGDTGPCGPCSEIHYYCGEDLAAQDPQKVNSGDPDYKELWNLVFIQYNALANGTLLPLKNKHVDTGAGFERIVSVLQNKNSNYETDLFRPIIDQIEAISNVAYDPGPDGMAHRVIADHVRMLSVAISDGAVPGNEGRSYVLRRILRRAARFGRELKMKEPFLYRLVPAVMHILGEVYPNLTAQREHVQRVIRAEEESFGNTLDKGLDLFDKVARKAQKSSDKMLPAEEVFRLYDTFGFPLDLTRLLAEEKGLLFDEAAVEILMEEQRERARAAGKFKVRDTETLNWTVIREGESSRFVGYETLETPAQLMKYALDEDRCYLVFDQTPFYAEAGGQIGDRGYLSAGEHMFRIDDTRKIGDDIVHIPEESCLESLLATDETILLRVNEGLRMDTARNHSATHLLHAVLRSVLGEHVHQAGSYVGPDRLRFDFSHFEKIPRDTLKEIRHKINKEILANIPVREEEKKYSEAIHDGVQALFGEKYGDVVRVIRMGEVSAELCGGTHVSRTGDIGSFRILAESSVAAGIRRIEALTGTAALELAERDQDLLDALSEELKCPENAIRQKIRDLQKELQQLEKANKALSTAVLTSDMAEYLKDPKSYKGHPLYVNRVHVESMDYLKELGDTMRGTMKSGIALFAAVLNDTPQLLCVVSDDLVKAGVSAAALVRILGKELGGGGGGKAHMATAGGRDAVKLDHLLENIESVLAAS
ncbi:MAG: alanine--tRNA ligase [Candidatus Marinimicrobia bacterium]|jgi:alanyl-tRNA synthetase|nr:alanine--tRNA ligase [Candidatus Neomarinimicrobiota bacterium]MDX9777401.1 alanine--tRNA ligase [bacterium]